MDEKKDFLVDDCDCLDDCMKLSIDDASEEDLDKLWEEADFDDCDVCASEKGCNKKKCILTAIAIGVIVAVAAVIIYKLCKKSKKED